MEVPAISNLLFVLVDKLISNNETQFHAKVIFSLVQL
jgi:hypothetical protein